MSEQIEITVERMGYGPEAVAHRADGKAVFVAGGAPGDTVRVEIVEEKASFCRARIVEIVEASPERTRPVCPLAGTCGGCSWQHLSYPAQLAAKRANVVSALVRTAHLPEARAEELVAECAPSKRETGYRNKLELAAEHDERGVFQLGFRPEGTHKLAVVDTCPVAVKAIERAPKALRGALRYLQGGQDLGIYRVGVRGSVRTRDVEIALWTTPGPFPRKAAADVLRSALKTTSIVRVMADPGKIRKIKGLEVLDGKGHWEEELAGFRFKTSAPSFFQVNTAQAERLVAFVLEALAPDEYAAVADLYSGGGTFSLPLAKAAGEVIAVESAGSSVRDLRRNAASNKVNVEVIGGDTARELPDLGELDALVVDPPRAGLADGVVEGIADARPARVAYISCDPATWARDVARFERCGYRLAKAQPVDMFPQTYHVEVASLFTRAGR